MTTKKAWAVWKGGIKDGGGTISTETGVLSEAPYGFKSRFENGKGTNPEELIGAAHAGCFSMALSLMLGQAGFEPRRIHTTAKVHIEKVGEGFKITHIELDTEADIPRIEERQFQEQAEAAKRGCPVSQALAGTEITLDARLVK